MTIDFSLNGKAVTADGNLNNITLLQWLRHEGLIRLEGRLRGRRLRRV
jgi:hypothetical protein